MWAEARRALPRLTTRRPFLGGGVGWEAAAGGGVSTPDVRRQGLVAHRKIYLGPRACMPPRLRLGEALACPSRLALSPPLPRPP
eukprot:scaffold15486_cov111-Isochrysis_galbana.AAC.8